MAGSERIETFEVSSLFGGTETITFNAGEQVSLAFTVIEPGLSSSNSLGNGEYYVDFDPRTMTFTAGFYDYGQEKSTWSQKGVESYRKAKCLCERHLALNAKGEES